MRMALSEKTNILAIRILSISAVLIGIGARIYAFCDVPDGLNQDEASIGYEAWCLLHYGMDRNGFRWPVHLMSWGSGQNALYAYLDMPFVAFGLTPLTVRLPMVLTATASLGLTWIVGRRLFGEKAAWCAMATVALCPWHIMLSRWALESNLLPFVFLSAVACLVMARNSKYCLGWLLCSCVLFGASLYAYGTAYLAVPIFLLGALALGISERSITPLHALFGGLVFAAIATPIFIYVLVNTFRWHTVTLVGLTIPSLPVEPRIHTMLTASPFLENARDLCQLLVTQSDITIRNVTAPYGILYSTAFFALSLAFAVMTAVLALQRRWVAMCALIAWWLIATLPTGLVQSPNINRINMLLMGMVVAAGLAFAFIDQLVRGAAVVSMGVLLVCSGFFIHTYFTDEPRILAVAYPSGFISALKRAQAVSEPAANICVTDRVNMPYIFALFTERTDPRVYLRTVKYADANEPMRNVEAFGRYTFDLNRCNFLQADVVISSRRESVPNTFSADQSFSSFVVYRRKKL